MATDTRVTPGDRQLHRDLTLGLADIPPETLDAVRAEATANGVRPHMTRLRRLTVRFSEPGELQAWRGGLSHITRVLAALNFSTVEGDNCSGCSELHFNLSTVEGDNFTWLNLSTLEQHG